MKSKNRLSKSGRRKNQLYETLKGMKKRKKQEHRKSQKPSKMQPFILKTKYEVTN